MSISSPSNMQQDVIDYMVQVTNIPWIKSFPSPRLVCLSQENSNSYDLPKGEQIPGFPKSISMKWNANNHIHNFKSGQ